MRYFLILILSLAFTNSSFLCGENCSATDGLIHIHSTINEHALKQPPFGHALTFTPKKESIKKPTYQQLGIQPKVIYAQDNFRGNNIVTDGFNIQKTDCVIFLIGPTYRQAAITQWRQDVLDHLAPHLPVGTIVVVPQFKNLSSSEVDPDLWKYQIEWEHQWLERANVLAINLSLHWINPDKSLGNIGPTTRFETGYYFAKSKQKDIVVFIPTDPAPSNIEWVNFHAKDLNIPIYHTYSEFYQALLEICHNK